MFKVLIGGRQTGATTKLIKMIKEDIENGNKVGIYGNTSEFDRIKNKITNFNKNKYLFHMVGCQDYKGMDKIYILNILDISENKLDILSLTFKEIWCDKPVPLPLFKKIEFDLAREYRYKAEMDMDELTNMIECNVDINLMLKYIKSPLTRNDVELVRDECGFGGLKRLRMVKCNTDNLRDFTGIIFI